MKNHNTPDISYYVQRRLTDRENIEEQPSAVLLAARLNGSPQGPSSDLHVIYFIILSHPVTEVKDS